VQFDEVLQAFMALNKSQAPGHGREGVIGILTKYLPQDPKRSVPKLAALNRNAEILADVNALMNVGANDAADYDPLA